MYSCTATSTWTPGTWYIEVYEPAWGWVCTGSYCWYTITGGAWRWRYLQGQAHA